MDTADYTGEHPGSGHRGWRFQGLVHPVSRRWRNMSPSLVPSLLDYCTSAPRSCSIIIGWAAVVNPPPRCLTAAKKAAELKLKAEALLGSSISNWSAASFPPVPHRQKRLCTRVIKCGSSRKSSEKVLRACFQLDIHSLTQFRKYFFGTRIEKILMSTDSYYSEALGMKAIKTGASGSLGVLFFPVCKCCTEITAIIQHKFIKSFTPPEYFGGLVRTWVWATYSNTIKASQLYVWRMNEWMQSFTRVTLQIFRYSHASTEDRV